MLRSEARKGKKSAWSDYTLVDDVTGGDDYDDVVSRAGFQYKYMLSVENGKGSAFSNEKFVK